MKHNFPRAIALGALAAAAVAGLIVMVPGAAFAAPSAATAAGATTTTGAATSSSTANTPVSNPRCTPALFTQANSWSRRTSRPASPSSTPWRAAANNTANHLTSGDRQTLQNDITTVELPGIEALQPQAQQAATCRALRTVARSMVFTYRVYVVMTPQTRLTVVMDDETYIEGVFVNLEPQIANAIADAQAAGKNVTAAQAAFADLKNQVSSAQTETAGQSSQLLAQSPGGYPGNWQVFLAARTNATNAHTDLHAAYADAQQIRTDLQ